MKEKVSYVFFAKYAKLKSGRAKKRKEHCFKLFHPSTTQGIMVDTLNPAVRV
jgi:hypothetical protein